MNKAEAIEELSEYQEDFEAIEDILQDTSLTPSEKVAEISGVVLEDENSDSEIEEEDE